MKAVTWQGKRDVRVWQAVVYADVPQDGSLAVFGLGPIGQLCVRVAKHHGDLTNGRGANSAINAVGAEARGDAPKFQP